MAITEITRAYETLIRHSENGVSAHHSTITEIAKDGVVINAQISPPKSLVDFSAELAPIIGETVIALLAERDEAKAEIARLQNQISQLQNQEKAA